MIKINNKNSFLSCKQDLISYSKKIGVDKIGFTDIEPLTEYLPYLNERRDKGYQFALNEGDPFKRINPLKHVPDAKSVIVIAVKYNTNELSPVLEDKQRRGRLSFISRGEDYHKIVGNKLLQLKNYIEQTIAKDSKNLLIVDNAEFLEKAFAVKAGVGWTGRNTLLINEELGSWFNLGEIISTVPFPPDANINISANCTKCATCQSCVTACPTKALDGTGRLNPDLCIASLTQAKGSIPRELRDQFGNAIYGCDICQKVCHFNKKTNDSQKGDIDIQHYDNAFPIIQDILHLSNREFIKQFGHTSGAWRGYGVWLRNAIIAAGNLGADELTNDLHKLLNTDPRNYIRATAAWALGKLNNDASISFLKEAQLTETDPDVINEIKIALKKT